jgi:hypothetical protein
MTYKYVVTTSINFKDKWFCIARDIKYQKAFPFITGEYISLKWMPESLRKPLYNQPRFVSYHLVVFIPFSNEYPLESNRKDSGRCRYHVNEHLSLLKWVKLNLYCLFPFVLVWAPFALCHGIRIWISKEIFSNDDWEAWVDNCSTTIIYLSRTNIVDENLLYANWCLMISQYEIIMVFWCASILFSIARLNARL